MFLWGFELVGGWLVQGWVLLLVLVQSQHLLVLGNLLLHLLYKWVKSLLIHVFFHLFLLLEVLLVFLISIQCHYVLIAFKVLFQHSQEYIKTDFCV